MIRRAFALACLGLLACDEPAPPRSRTEPLVVAAKELAVAGAGLAPKPAFVLLPEAGGSVAIAADGPAGKPAPDQRVFGKGGLLTITLTRAQKPYLCEGNRDDAAYDSTHLSLDDRSGTETVLVKPLEYGGLEAARIELLRTEVRAIIGPLVFVHTSHTSFACGAMHSYTGEEGHLFDARTGREVKLTAPPSARAAAAEKLAGKGFDDSSVELLELAPHVDASGHVTASWRFTQDGQWVEGPSTVDIPAVPLPTILAPFADPPPALAAYLKAHPQPSSSLCGWSADPLVSSETRALSLDGGKTAQ